MSNPLIFSRIQIDMKIKLDCPFKLLFFSWNEKIKGFENYNR